MQSARKVRGKCVITWDVCDLSWKVEDSRVSRYANKGSAKLTDVLLSFPRALFVSFLVFVVVFVVLFVNISGSKNKKHFRAVLGRKYGP